MKITSMDVHRKEFGHAVRGYREDEVDDFLDAVALELDRLHAQIAELDDRLRQAESKSLNFEAERNTINNALLTAQRASDDVLEQAKIKGRKLLEDANARAEKKLRKAQKEKKALVKNIEQLKATEEQFRADILAQVQATMDQLKEVKAPSTSILDSSPAPQMVSPAAIEDVFASAVEEVPPAAPAPAKPVPPSAPVAPPPIKKEEGVAQWGEMEDDLETID